MTVTDVVSYAATPVATTALGSPTAKARLALVIKRSASSQRSTLTHSS